MSLQLLPLEEKDIPELAILDEEAMAGWPYAEAMDQTGRPRREFVEEWTRKNWGQDKTQYWFKVVDTETGEMAAFALWGMYLEPQEIAAAPSSAVEAEKLREDVVEPAQVGTENTDAANFWADSARLGKQFKDQHIGTKPHAYLQVLCTRPKYQRRGAGSMLVKWGCDKADEHGVLCALQASQKGLSVYTKHGFEVRREVDLDLRPYGVDATELRRGMIRDARTT